MELRLGALVSPTFRALRNHNYRLYLAGSVVSNTGTWMQRVAQDWLVLSLPGTGGTQLGITTGLQFLPMLLLSPYAGVIADRVPKRTLLQLTQLSMAVSAFMLGLLAVSGHAQVWQVYVLAFPFGVGAAFDGPARQSFVSEMVGREDLTNAVGLNSASFNLARLMGPAAAGLLIGRARRRCRRLGLGDPDQRRVLPRGHPAAAPDGPPAAAHGRAARPDAGCRCSKGCATSAPSPRC